MTCSRCGLRLSYKSKGDAHGQTRQFLPEPNLLRATMEALEQSVPPTQCTEELVNGKMMELKGLMLQNVVTSTMSMHMTWAGYQEKLREATNLQPPPFAKSPPATPGAQQNMDVSAQSTKQLSMENELLRNRLSQAEATVTEALRRTEQLAEESMKQKEAQAKQSAEMDQMRASAKSSAAPKAIPNGYPPETKNQDGINVAVQEICDEENPENKKRSREQQRQA